MEPSSVVITRENRKHPASIQRPPRFASISPINWCWGSIASHQQTDTPQSPAKQASNNPPTVIIMAFSISNSISRCNHNGTERQYSAPRRLPTPTSLPNRPRWAPVKPNLPVTTTQDINHQQSAPITHDRPPNKPINVSKITPPPGSL